MREAIVQRSDQRTHRGEKALRVARLLDSGVVGTAETAGETAARRERAAGSAHSSMASVRAKELDDLFERLSRSSFRRRFRLSAAEQAYARRKGTDAIRRHAQEFVARRLALARPLNDGKQTPMRGHPVFVAQHATATFCRGCLSKWHRIPQGQALVDTELAYAVDVIVRWLDGQAASGFDELYRMKTLPLFAFEEAKRRR